MSSIITGVRLFRTAVIATLKADPTLMGIVKAVLRYVPPGSEHSQPYLLVGPLVLPDASLLTEDSIEITLPVNIVWGRAEYVDDDEPLMTIIERVYDLLNNQEITVPGFDNTGLQCLEASEEEDADGRGYDGHLFFQVTISEKAETF